METSKPPDRCSCDLHFGVDQLSTQDVLNSQELERKYKITEETILFKGPGFDPEESSMQFQFDKLKERIAHFYFETSQKLIAIPNQIALPNDPRFLDPNEKDKKIRKENKKYKDHNLEDILHHEIISVLRSKGVYAFIILGFKSEYCLKAKVEKSRELRRKIQCKCRAKSECRCDKPKCAKLNIHEKQILEILNEEEELLNVTEMLKNSKLQEEEQHMKDDLNTKGGESKAFLEAKEALDNFNRKVQEITMEWDSLLVLPESKMIVNIEVKNSVLDNALEKASGQTNRHLNIFKRIFGAVLSEDWKFVKAAFIPKMQFVNVRRPCAYCKQFIITETEFFNIDKWIENLTNSCKIYKDNDFKGEYENLLVGIIGFSSIRQTEELNKLVVDPYDFNKEIERKMTNRDTGIQGEDYSCYMLTPEQLNADKDPAHNMIILGKYGTGKTLVLKEKTKSYAVGNPLKKIAYINLTTNTDDFLKNDQLIVMDNLAEKTFKHFNNVEVVTVSNLKEHYLKYKDQIGRWDVNSQFNQYSRESANEDCGYLLEHFLEHNSHYDKLFIDEMPPVVRTNTHNTFLTLDKSKSFCVTLKYVKKGKSMNEEWIKQMKIGYNAIRIELKHNMRNTNIIESLAICFDPQAKKQGKLIDIHKIPKNISGAVCYHYSDTFELGQNLLARAAVNKYFPNPKEPVVVLHDDCSKVKPCGIYLELRQKFASDREVVFLPVKKDDYGFKKDKGKGEKSDYEKYRGGVEEFLEKPEGILVADIDAFQGAQARNTIIFIQGDYSPRSVRNMILRTMSFTVLIHSKPFLKLKSPGLVRNEDLHEYVYVGNKVPICHFYTDEKKVDVNAAAVTIAKKYIMNNPLESILIMTLYGEEQICQQFKENFPDREVILQPRLSTFEDPDKQRNDLTFSTLMLKSEDVQMMEHDKEKYFYNLKSSLDKTKAIVVANLFDVEHTSHKQPDHVIENLQALLEKFTNIVIFSLKEVDMNKTKKERQYELLENLEKRELNANDWIDVLKEEKGEELRNFICQTSCASIITHIRNIRLFKPLMKCVNIEEEL